MEGFLLQEQLADELQRQCDRSKIFTEVELMKATNNFHESRILGCGGQGIVYKGVLPNNQMVAIKKSRIVEDPRQVKDFVNEVVMLSQINNRNVMKLLGCCLETKAPLLVYEFEPNSNLFNRINPAKNAPHLVLICTQLLQTGKLNEKSVVYSFGIVLIELITEKKAIQLCWPEHEKTLVAQFLSSLEEEHLMELLDKRVLNQSNIAQVMEVVSLARKCVRLFGEERPTMNQVAKVS